MKRIWKVFVTLTVIFTLFITCTVSVFASTNEQVLETVVIKVDKKDLINGSIQYGLTIEKDGSISARPTGFLIDFGMESYDGALELQSWNGSQILFSIRLRSTNAKMTYHGGTVSIHKVGFLNVIGDVYNSQTFGMRSPIPVNLLSQTYQMYVGSQDEIYIKLTNLRVTRASDSMTLSIPNSQKYFNKKDF